MPKVLVIGESWFTYTVHQKGFDAFYTGDYVEGAGVFLQVLADRGHEVTYVPSHEIHTRVPDTEEGLAEFDVIVISDVGANSFQLPPQTFLRSEPATDKTELIRQFTANGGGLLMVGGYLTFSGVDAKARWGRTPMAEALPVQILDRDDRIELPAGANPTTILKHPIVGASGQQWPALLGLNEVTASSDSLVLAECGGYPLVVIGDYRQGRSAAFTSDLAPHWVPPTFLAWDGYAELWDQLVHWLAGTSL